MPMMPLPEVAVTLYFGKKWDAPMLDEDGTHRIMQVRTPFWRRCLLCQHRVRLGERGTMMGIKHKGKPVARPVHMECLMKSTSGCYFRELAGEPHEHLDDYRAEALFVLKCVNKLRASQGMGPL